VINSFAHTLLRAERVEDAVWAVAKHAIAQLGFVDCVVYLVDDESQCLFQAAAHGPKNPVAFDIKNPITLSFGEGVCGAVAKSGESILINDTSIDPRYKVDDAMRYSELAVPIISQGKVIGVIDSENEEKNFYSEDDKEILETIASMVSVKIDQARNQEQLENHQRMLQGIVEEKTSELKSTIDQLKESNTQQEILLKEIHHRVKNNLQIISSLLNMHAAKSDSLKDANLFMDCQNRIKSMSIIHDQLYNKGDLSRIDAANYIREISKQLILSFRAQERVELQLNLEEITMPIEQSVPFGLILNELLVNALKHGLPEIEGTITIDLTTLDQNCKLLVTDTGMGFDPTEAETSMGLELIDTLSNQLDGQWKISSDAKGTIVQVSFPLI